MQRNTPLDYAEFLLTRTRTRCELHIFANGVEEKLASGFFKPFVTHLKAAEAQFAKGNQVIRLERPSNLLKKNKVTWFTKGTLERFVRFVSTPEVLERVKSIEDELSQLENVRVALSKTFPQSEVSFQAMDTSHSSSGVFQAKDGISMMQKSSLGADDNGADASKIELLRAMDVRLAALKQEQSAAFSRAEAAGFDSSNMADILDFSEHFGADRLRDACIQFITLFRTRTTSQEIIEESESPLADAASSGSDMSLESGTDFELVAEPEVGFPLNVKEAWPKALKSSVSNDAEKQMGRDLKPGLKQEKDISTSHAYVRTTSVRTRSRWGPPERIQINCMEPEVSSLQNSEVVRKVEEAKHQAQSYTHQDDSRHGENEMKTFRAEGLHSTMRLEKQLSLPQKLSLIEASGSTSSSPRARKQQGDKQGGGINKGGMFFTHLQKMTQQVEARRSGEDLGVHFTSVEMSDESPGSQVSALGSSSSLFESALKSSESIPSVMVADGVCSQPQMQETKVVPGYLPPGTSPVLQDKLKVGRLQSGNSSSLITSVVEHSGIEDEVKKRKDSLAKPGEINETVSDNNKIKDDQEKPVSTSARRLSVQAAISLFESKKASVGEPPTRKLARQDSQKGAVQRQDSQKGADQSGSSTSKNSVLRRWSAVGSASLMVDMQDKAPDSVRKESEKVVEMENATEKDESMSRNSSLKIDKVPQSGTDKSSTQASQLFRNTFPHLISAQPSDASDVSSKQRPSAQHQSFVKDSATLSGEALQRQFKQELEQSLSRKSQNSIGMDDVLPSKAVAGSSKTSDVILRRRPVDLKTESRDEERVSVSNMVLEVRRNLGNEENQCHGEKNVKIVSDNLAENERAPRRQPGKADCSSKEILQISKTDNNGENRLSFGNSVELEKEPSFGLHDTPVDLYMQALVMMIDNQHQSTLSLGDEESQKQQRGRFYEHYLRLRNARQREEPPAKRAEKEAKLKSMKETLERRKAEMEAGALRQRKQGSNLVKEQKHQVQKSGPLIPQREEEGPGEGEEVGKQDQLFYESKHHVPKTKAQAPKKTAPKLQKSASAPRSMTTATSTPRTIPKKPTGTGTIVNHRNLTASSNSGPMDNPMHSPLPVDSRRVSVRTAASLKRHEKINGQSQFVNDAAATAESRNTVVIVDDLSRTAGAQAFDQVILESFKGHQDVGPETLSSSVAQNVKPFLNQGHGMLPGPGIGIMKQKVLDSRHSLQRYNEEAFSVSNGYEEATFSVSVGKEEIEGSDLRKSLEPDDLNCTIKHAVSILSTPLDKCRSNGDGSHLVNKRPPDSLDVEATSYVFEDATNDERILYFNEADQEKDENNLSKDQLPAKFSDGDDSFEKDSCTMISAEKMTELSQSDSNSSPSVLQECTTSTYSDAVASPDNSFEGHFGTVLGTYSPKPALPTGSPLGSPLSWKSSKTKHPSESDFSHGSPQKLVSMLSQQPSKEPARGFKRLLHFARKSRASEAVSTDGISVFTTSEGDTETEEAKELMRQSSDEPFGVAKLQEKGSRLYSNKDPYGFQEQGATHSLRNSIPTLSSNFKPREDHLSGGTSLKAPRSFFSLSTFRSRGSEAKSR